MVVRLADDDLGAVGGGRVHDRAQHAQVVETFFEGRDSGQPVDAGDLLKKSGSLPDEQVVLTMADAGKVHRQSTGDVRVRRAYKHLAVTGGGG